MNFNWGSVLADLHRFEPVIIGWFTSGAVAVLAGNLLHVSSTQEAAITTIATALVTIYSAWRTRPVPASLFTGALTTIVVAAGAFGLHLSAPEIGALVAVISAVMSLVLRQNVTPSNVVEGHTVST